MTPSAAGRTATPGPAELFRTFLIVGCSAFGGAMPWARRMVVQRRRWLRADEFADLLALCQFLPGPNVINLATSLGEKFRGPAGALAALAGLLLVPMLVLTGIAALYARFGHLGVIHGLLGGMASAAAGLALALAAQVARPLIRRRPAATLPVIAAGFAAVGLIGWPVPWVMFALAPVSIALAWRRSS